LGKFRPKRFLFFTGVTPRRDAFSQTSVRWSQTKLAKIVVKKGRNSRRFGQKMFKTPFKFHVSVWFTLLRATLATSGRWSKFRHKRTLAPVA
jgi:hypothetical protein